MCAIDTVEEGDERRVGIWRKASVRKLRALRSSRCWGMLDTVVVDPLMVIATHGLHWITSYKF